MDLRIILHSATARYLIVCLILMRALMGYDLPADVEDLVAWIVNADYEAVRKCLSRLFEKTFFDFCVVFLSFATLALLLRVLQFIAELIMAFNRGNDEELTATDRRQLEELNELERLIDAIEDSEFRRMFNLEPARTRNKSKTSLDYIPPELPTDAAPEEGTVKSKTSLDYIPPELPTDAAPEEGTVKPKTPKRKHTDEDPDFVGGPSNEGAVKDHFSFGDISEIETGGTDAIKEISIAVKYVPSGYMLIVRIVNTTGEPKYMKIRKLKISEIGTPQQAFITLEENCKGGLLKALKTLTEIQQLQAITAEEWKTKPSDSSSSTLCPGSDSSSEGEHVTGDKELKSKDMDDRPMASVSSISLVGKSSIGKGIVPNTPMIITAEIIKIEENDGKSISQKSSGKEFESGSKFDGMWKLNHDAVVKEFIKGLLDLCPQTEISLYDEGTEKERYKSEVSSGSDLNELSRDALSL